MLSQMLTDDMTFPQSFSPSDGSSGPGNPAAFLHRTDVCLVCSGSALDPVCLYSSLKAWRSLTEPWPVFGCGPVQSWPLSCYQSACQVKNHLFLECFIISSVLFCPCSNSIWVSEQIPDFSFLLPCRKHLNFSENISWDLVNVGFLFLFNMCFILFVSTGDGDAFSTFTVVSNWRLRTRIWTREVCLCVEKLFHSPQSQSRLMPVVPRFMIYVWWNQFTKSGFKRRTNSSATVQFNVFNWTVKFAFLPTNVLC